MVTLLMPATAYADSSKGAMTHDRATVSVHSDSVHQNKEYTVNASMVDLFGNPFFSGFDLVSSSGKHYERDWHYDNIFSGTCTFTNIPAGKYTIQFYYSTYHPLTKYIEVQHDRNVRVRLSTPTYTISGTALDSTGQPLAHDEVLLVAPYNTGGYWPATNSDGTFTLSGIPNGTYTLEISNGWSNNMPSVLLSEQVTVNNGDVDLGTLTATN